MVARALAHREIVITLNFKFQDYHDNKGAFWQKICEHLLYLKNNRGHTLWTQIDIHVTS